MKLLTSHLKEPTRSIVRFVILGTVGTGVQYGLYYGFLELIDLFHIDSHFWVNAAFTVAFVLEMIFNYFMSAYYTFGTRPSWKNAGGFLGARSINFLLQLGGLNLFLWLGLSDEWAGITTILVAGVINYFIMCIFFKEKEQQL